MGVSLERVQFKFASIIGELCSEPDVLSQFAVWLDLRLAEYKLKGAISLDCSGVEPNPVWLKGLNKGKKSTQETSMTTAVPPGRSAVDTDTCKAERLAFNDSVTGQGVHTCTVETSTPQTLSTPRKRSAAKRKSQITPKSSPKQRCLSSASDTADNQSLMSVIGSYHEDSQASTSQDNDSANVGELQLQDMVIQATENSQISEAVSGHEESLNVSSSAAELLEVPGCVAISIPEASPNIVQAVRRGRIKNVEEMSQPTVKNMTRAVERIERWIWNHNPDEKRFCNDMPPQLFDSYLKQFFVKSVSASGADYSTDAFMGLRCNLVKFLKATGYPHCIKRSPIFQASKQAYRDRLQNLHPASAVTHAQPSEQDRIIVKIITKDDR